jgi:hypothetical protein
MTEMLFILSTSHLLVGIHLWLSAIDYLAWAPCVLPRSVTRATFELHAAHRKQPIPVGPTHATSLHPPRRDVNPCMPHLVTIGAEAEKQEGNEAGADSSPLAIVEP